LLVALIAFGCKEESTTAPSGTRVPDFSLPDVNPASPTAGTDVSPRDYEGKVSAWYFGHAT
jgi:hypothetical protein